MNLLLMLFILIHVVKLVDGLIYTELRAGIKINGAQGDTLNSANLYYRMGCCTGQDDKNEFYPCISSIVTNRSSWQFIDNFKQGNIDGIHTNGINQPINLEMTNDLSTIIFTCINNEKSIFTRIPIGLLSITNSGYPVCMNLMDQTMTNISLFDNDGNFAHLFRYNPSHEPETTFRYDGVLTMSDPITSTTTTSSTTYSNNLMVPMTMQRQVDTTIIKTMTSSKYEVNSATSKYSSSSIIQRSVTNEWSSKATLSISGILSIFAGPLELIGYTMEDKVDSKTEVGHSTEMTKIIMINEDISNTTHESTSTTVTLTLNPNTKITIKQVEIIQTIKIHPIDNKVTIIACYPLENHCHSEIILSQMTLDHVVKMTDVLFD